MEGYKAFNAGWKCRDFQYEIGKTYELPEGQTLKMCECGFHFCKNPIDVFGYYSMNNETLIAKVEALGDIQQEGTKYCTNKIKIVREFTRNELQALILDGKCNAGENNSGYCNSGSYNSGDYNSGKHNSGKHNSGDYNSGDYNSGYCNSGYCNSGSYNSGDYNSGKHNSGDYNSGYCNSGYCNSGDYNSGDYNSGKRNSGKRNSGYCNSGDYNSGDYNSGDYNSGIFNTNEPFIRSFNKETDMTFSEFFHSIDYSFNDLCLRISENNLLDKDYARIKALPNFDPNIFKEITGIDITGR